MDHKRILRLLCALLCAALLMTDAPADVVRAAADIAEPAAGIERSAPEGAEEVPQEEAADEAPSDPEESGEAAPDGASEDSSETTQSEAERRAELEALAAGWVSDMDALGATGDRERALWLYDRVIANFERGSADDALTALMTLSGSPLGYASACEALLDAAGIECQIVVEGEDAWIIAKLDGEWAHIDAWADDAPGQWGEHFGLSDEAMAADHRWSAELPACAGINPAPGEGEPDADQAEADEGEEAPGEGEAESDALKLEGEIEARAAREATSVVPSVESLVLGKGESAVIGYALLPEGAQEEVTFSANPAGIVVGDQSGNIVARKTGNATVTLTAESGASAEVKVSVKKAPSKVSITCDRKLLGVGETLQLDGKLPSSAAGKVQFSLASGGEFASITEDGLLTARAPGTAKVIAETYNHKKSKAVSIEIRPAPTAVTPPMEELKIGLNDSWTPEWAIDEGSAGKLCYTSSNPAVADVDPDSGEIRALSLGSAVITASVCGVSGSLPVSVVPAPTALDLGEAPTLGVKQTLQLEPLLLTNGARFEGNVCTLTYKSSKSSVASVSASGLVTAKKKGSATISVKTSGGISASYTLAVKKAPSSIGITADRRTLGVGETLRLGYNLKPSGTVGTVRFSISESQQGIATVTEDGLLTAHAPGKFQVNATTHNKKKKSLSLEVLPAPKSIEIKRAPELLGLNATEQVIAEVNEGSAGALRFRALDPETGADSDAAEIDAEGRITGRKLGPVVIEVSSYVEGLRATANVTVVPSPERIQLPESIDLGLDDKYQIVPLALPEGCAASYKYKSSKSSRVAVNEDGLMKGKKTGKATITVEANNGATASMTVNVKKKPSSVTLSQEALTLGVGEQAKLEAQISKNSATTLRYSSDGDGVVSIAPDGTVSALSEGRATITVETHNGKRDTCSVTVVPAPTAIRFEDSYRISEGQKNFSPSYALEPDGAHTSLTFELVSGEGVKIEDNRILATARKGEAVVRASTHVEGLCGEFTVTVVPEPDAISLPENFFVALNGPGAQLTPSFEPAESASDLTFKITSKMKKASSYFSIDAQTGWITPLKETSSGVEVTVTAQNGASAKTMVWVAESLNKPLVLKYLGESPVSLQRNETYTPEVYVFPDGADPKILWSSSDTSIATVDQDGTVAPAGRKSESDPWPSGRVTITGTSASNAKLTIQYKVIVLSDARCLIMPQHRTTDSSTVDDTEKAILRVRASAYAELDELVADGDISESERNKRQKFVDRAFSMYDFSWSPNAKKGYWKAANSEGGEKDFRPDTIYFGMPYTQNSRTNWPDKLIDKGYVTPESNYYRTTDKFKSRSYPGSDCSSFCSMAVWGYSDAHNADTTTMIASNGVYNTLDKKHWTALRPGDLICASGHHVVMFLYYTNVARTQFVVIEQGGGGDDPYSNCVSTSIRDASYYKNRSYTIRRPKGLATN